VRVRPPQPAQIDADAERIAVQLKRDAPAKVEFEVQVANRVVIDAGMEAVVAHQVRGARGKAGGRETLAVFGRATGTAFG